VAFHALHTKTLLYLITNSLHREYIFAQEIREWADIDNRTDTYYSDCAIKDKEAVLPDRESKSGGSSLEEICI
jgi:hypothetical protein